ncbi:M15 family metallopeptidase [Maridesulfovibrio bastinii]|uniref:M15 family metallopeptidase n=1 Tax=Maridesulfovibrio bastinii TaxID=47157 RepID=UPI00041208A1|nr:M15 family metallopeptidase [Maridesulfovibrio bastinii]
MNRRNFIKIISAAAASLASLSMPENVLAGTEMPLGGSEIKDYLHRMKDFDSPHKGDIILSPKKQALLKSSLARLKRVQHTIGFGNFYLIGFDSAIIYAGRYSSIGSFTKQEKNFLDEIFHTKASEYGFMGDKPLSSLTGEIRKKKVIKIRGTGNYLYRGRPEETFRHIKKQLGSTVMLTSGVRGIMKQFLLFLDKAHKNGGNLSLASRSLAPPGYSFHGVGDFDVGQSNLGAANFSIKFTETETCRKLQQLGYLKLRYPQDNMLGVRYEPWHIKVKDAKV